MKKQSALILFLGNINYDTRATNLYKSLKANGFDVKVVSFDWLTPGFKSQKGEISIYKLNKKNSSIFYYLSFAAILTSRLIFSRYELYFAEDIYTLPFAAVANLIKRGRMFYDSREIYSHLAGLKNRKYLQLALRLIEKFFIKKAERILVTGKMDGEYIRKLYNVDNILVIRNLPLYCKPKNIFDYYTQLNIPKDKKILLYQGMVVHGRGLKIMLELMQKLPDCILIVLGGGEYYDYYLNMAKELNISDKVFFMGKFTQESLLSYTAGATIGFALIENLSLSYYYALPNKLFEYINAEVPMIVSNFPQMVEVIDEYKVGYYVDPENLPEISQAVSNIITDPELYAQLRENCRTASGFLNWEIEIKKLFKYL